MTTPVDGIPSGVARLAADARAVLTGLRPGDPGQEALRRDFLAHLREHPDGVSRDGPPVHLTVGVLVLDAPAERVLLVLHGKARAWFQPGGHLESGDASLREAAAREAREETGLTGLELGAHPVHLDRHDLPGTFGRCRTHLDVRYAAVAPPGATPTASPESLDVAWWPADALPAGAGDLVPLVAAGRAALRP